MRSFQPFQKKKHISLPIGIILFLGMLLLFIFAINRTTSSSVERQKEALRNATERNIIHCYALEGFYPPSLEYMEQHYGLTYDPNLFMIDYRPIGSNIHPDFTIIQKGNHYE